MRFSGFKYPRWTTKNMYFSVFKKSWAFAKKIFLVYYRATLNEATNRSVKKFFVRKVNNYEYARNDEWDDEQDDGDLYGFYDEPDDELDASYGKSGTCRRRKAY